MSEAEFYIYRWFYIIVPIHQAGREDRRKKHTHVYVGDGTSLT